MLCNASALADDVHNVIIEEQGQAQFFSLAIDESTDKTDVAPLCIFVNCFDGKEIKKELLALIPLEGSTRGDIMFSKLEELFTLHGLSNYHWKSQLSHN